MDNSVENVDKPSSKVEGDIHMNVEEVMKVKGWIPEVYEEDSIDQEPIPVFYNAIMAYGIIKSHFEKDSIIAVHCDIDTDGVSSGYIMRQFASLFGKESNLRFIINKDRVHGVQEATLQWVKESGAELFIVLDSSSSMLKELHGLGIDVIVIDHHEVEGDDLLMVGENHMSMVVSNMVPNRDAIVDRNYMDKVKSGAEEMRLYTEVDSDMSCGVVLYELLRFWSVLWGTSDLLRESNLYQWAAVTLFSDSVRLVNKRNQWYVHNTLKARDNGIEASLLNAFNALNKYEGRAPQISKTFISFELAPLINGAIRDGENMRVLSIVLSGCKALGEIESRKELLKGVLDECMKRAIHGDGYVLLDITPSGGYKNYCGVLASRVVDSSRCVAVYVVEDGIAQGSFRGNFRSVDYRKAFEEHSPGIFAKGHKASFGFKVPVEMLEGAMKTAKEAADSREDKETIVVDGKGFDRDALFYVDTMDDVVENWGLYRLGVGNAKVNGSDEVTIMVPRSSVRLEKQIGKLYLYRIGNLQCKAFEELSSNYIRVYPEMVRELEIYLRNA